jgi:hypothetical protein
MLKIAVVLLAVAIGPAHSAKGAGGPPSRAPSVAVRGTVLEVITGPRGRTLHQVHAGVVVRARKTGTGPGAISATTDRHGRFRLLLWAKAEYAVSVIVGPPTVSPARLCATATIRTHSRSQQLTLRCPLR